MAIKGIRDDLYEAMRAALTSNAGYIYRGADRQTGPQTGRNTLLNMERWGWARLVRAKIRNGRNQQIRHEVAGGWLTRKGRAALRAEILRRGDDMPARLATPTRSLATPTRRTATPAYCTRPTASPAPARTATALLERPRSITAQVEPFALITTAAGQPDDIPF